MSELATYQQSGLPDTLEDLSRFVLVGREKLTSVRAAIRAIDRVQLAQEVRDQKMEEARMLSEALLDAEVRLGEMTRHLPKASPDRGNQYTGGKTTVLSDSQKSKTVTVRELGFTPKQVERFETLAVNKDLVEQVKREARENDDIPTRTQVLNLAAYRKKQQEQEDHQISEDAKRHKALITMVYTVLKFIPDDAELDAITDSALRSSGGNVAEDIQDIGSAIAVLSSIKNRLIEKGTKYGKKG